MMRNLFFKRVLLTAVAVWFTGVLAMGYDGHAPLQAMIDREKSQFEFKTVNNVLIKDNNNPTREKAAQCVSQASFFTLNFSNLSQLVGQNNRCITLELPNPQGGTFQISMVQYSSLTSGFSVDADNGDKVTPYNYNRGLHYRGVLEGIPGSLAAFSFFDNEIYGLFSIPGVGNFTIVPNTMETVDPGNSHYIMYNDADLLISAPGPGCGTDQLPNMKKALGSADAQAKNVFNNCKEVTIYLRADYETYYDKNQSLLGTTNFVTAVFNVISTIYRNEGIYLALHKVIVNTASDEYQPLSTSSSSTFLNKFGQVTQNNMQGANLAVLFSTRGGGMGGVAWLDVLCENYQTWQGNHFGPYAFVNINTANPNNFPTYSWNTAATAHELGHNLGSPHTHSCSWSATGLGSQAIDRCWTLEDGPCTVIGGVNCPTAGGTVMSYCHLTQYCNVGVNLSNGFGTQPGNLIRNTVNTSSCSPAYWPNIPITNTATLTNANRECTDPTGMTFYWNDGTNADTSGDRLVLKIKKGTNNIGNLDQTGFTVQGQAVTGYGTGTGVSFNLPTGTGMPAGTEFAMRRYWKITPLNQPATAVDVYVPFTNTDISDVDGSVPGAPATVSNFMFYNLLSASLDPNPSAGLSGATNTNIKLYTNSSTSTTTTWKSSPVGTTQFAQYQTTFLRGGTGFINYIHPLSSLSNMQNSDIAIYPNPFSDSWNINIPVNEDMTLQVFSTDGKVVQTQALHNGTNVVNSKNLAPGMYFYRVTGATNTYTGSIVKE